MKVIMWGTRGSIAVPGPDTLRFGGNTSCLQVEISDAPPLVVDAGTGIRALGKKLLDQGPPERVVVLITHAHWDHIIGFPFFAPLFSEGCLVQIGGWAHGPEALSGIFVGDSHHCGNFPVPMDNLPARVEKLPALGHGQFPLGKGNVRCIALKHPGEGMGFRFEEGDKAVVFITDNELKSDTGPAVENFVKFCRGAQVLIHDAQYLPEEIGEHQGWGHSTWADALELARWAGVERLILTHHDPERDDLAVERLERDAQRAASGEVAVEAAYEGLVIEI